MDYINDRSEVPASIDEIADQIAVFAAEDRPRYIFTENGESGYLGFQEFPYPSKPVFSTEVAGGSLEQGKYYSIFVVPFNGNIATSGVPINGNRCEESVPKAITGKSDDTRTAYDQSDFSIEITNPTGTTFRYILGDELADFTEAVIGGTMTSVGFTNAGNDVTAQTITGVDSANRWVEITNGSGVVESDDVNSQIGIIGASVEMRNSVDKTNYDIVVSNPSGTTFRYTLGSALADFVNAETGGLFVSTGFTNSANNVSAGIITAVDGSKRYVEITNASGVAESGDINCQIVASSISINTLNFTVPTHPQMRVEVVGTATAQDGTTITDSTKAFTVDALIGKELFNVETGVSYTITDNTATVITTAGHTFATGARYQVQTSFCTYRVVYVAEWAVAEGVTGLETSTFYLNGIIADNTTTTYTLTSYAAGETFLGNAYQPPNASFCHNVGDVLYAGGQLDHQDVGSIDYKGTTHEVDAADEDVAIVIADTYDSILSLTLVTATFGDIVIGSYVSITGSEDGGNDIEDARVLWVSTNKKVCHIVNATGVANADDSTMVLTFTPNYVEGTAAEFSEGMADANFQMTDIGVGSAQIAWVDTINQKIGLSSLIDSLDVTTTDYKIWQSFHVYYSDFRNPHRWKTTSIVEVGDTVVALDSIGKYLIIFCKSSAWRWNTLEVGGAPELLSDNIFFDAPWSVCGNGSLLVFFDGEGFSITDSINVLSVTTFKARDYLSQINKAYANKIQGIYDSQNGRFIFSFPMGNEVLNNYGLYLSEGSWNCNPFSRPDCNALFSGYEDGDLSIYHGTSGDLSNGYGQIWSQDGATDGLTGTESITNITDITDQVITVEASGEVTWSRGDVVTAYPVAGGNYRQLIIKAVSETATDPYTYELTFDDTYDLTLFDELDYILYGLIPFDYGIKWTDFSSPQYLNRVRALHFDIFGMTGKFWCDQYLDLDETPKQTTEHDISATTFKVVIPFKYGYGYVHGFRIRGFSSTEFKINSFERVFEVKI